MSKRLAFKQGYKAGYRSIRRSWFVLVPPSPFVRYRKNPYATGFEAGQLAAQGRYEAEVKPPRAQRAYVPEKCHYCKGGGKDPVFGNQRERLWPECPMCHGKGWTQ